MIIVLEQKLTIDTMVQQLYNKFLLKPLYSKDCIITDEPDFHGHYLRSLLPSLGESLIRE